MKIKTIIIRYLDVYSGTEISSHQIQLNIPLFALRLYGVKVNPETCSREWRKLREQSKFLEDNGYAIEEKETRSKEKLFVIRRLSEIHRNSQRRSQE